MGLEEAYMFEYEAPGTPFEVTLKVAPCRASSTGQHIYVTHINGHPAGDSSARQYIERMIYAIENPIRLAAIEEYKQKQAQMQEAEMRAEAARKEAARERLKAAVYRIPTKTTCLVEHDSEETFCGDSFNMWDHLPNLKCVGTVGEVYSDVPLCQACEAAIRKIHKEAE